MGKGRIWFAYRHNTANVDPQPITHRMLERVEELKEDYAKEDFLRLLHRIAELELKFEHMLSHGGVVDFKKHEKDVVLKAGEAHEFQKQKILLATQKKFGQRG